MKKKTIGIIGEKKAVLILQNKGFQILQTNFRCSLGEIDIIARDENTIVFVEVKTRTNIFFGYPYESVTKRKLYQIKKAGLLYCQNNHYINFPLRIDVVSILLSPAGEVASFELLKNVSG